MSSTPPKPDYEPFADQVREAVAETLADNARYQEQARRLLEGQGEGDVTPASPTISQRGPGRSFLFLPGEHGPGAVLSGYCCFLCSASTSQPPRSYRCSAL
jgi:hypothetical protein